MPGRGVRRCSMGQGRAPCGGSGQGLWLRKERATGSTTWIRTEGGSCDTHWTTGYEGRRQRAKATYGGRHGQASSTNRGRRDPTEAGTNKVCGASTTTTLSASDDAGLRPHCISDIDALRRRQHYHGAVRNARGGGTVGP
jgi:hypothetical protein